MTHTLVQIYNPLQWYESVCKVSKYRRGFKVPFAIDLGTWIIAFTSLDGLSTVSVSHVLAPPLAELNMETATVVPETTFDHFNS